MNMNSPDFSREKEYRDKGYLIIGVDEVGRGALAGPIVAGAVLFQSGTKNPVQGNEKDEKIIINDSKKLTAKQRERAAEWIYKNCWAYGIGEAGVAEINRIGIGSANRLAMKRAVRNLKSQISKIKSKSKILNLYILVDGYRVKYLAKHQEGIIHGDAKCFSIAAASIIAKVYRDRLMHDLAVKYRGYGWEQNAGYGTKKHCEGIKEKGICRIHRKLFVRKILGSKMPFSPLTAG